MGALSIWHIVILTAIAILLFGGRGKVSDLMGDVAKGIRSFRAGLSDSEQMPPASRHDNALRVLADRTDR